MNTASGTRRNPPAPTRRMSDGTRVPPHDLNMERSLLGAAMLSAQAAEVCCNLTTPEDYYKPAYGIVRESIEHILYAEGQTPDMQLVWRRIVEVYGDPEVRLSPDLQIDLLDMVAQTPSISNANIYAKKVAQLAVLRRLCGVGAEITEIAYNTATDDLSPAIDTARSYLDQVAAPLSTDRYLPTIDELVDQPSEYDWVIPGLLEKMDRMILTGPEGKGKSTFLRQFAVCCAAGVHPFTGQRMKPIRVVVVDVENGERLLSRRYRTLRNVASTTLNPDYLRIASRPEGLDLLSPRDAMWLQEVVASNRPELLIIGPVYKLHRGDPNDEQPAVATQRVLDICRTRFGGTALLIEGHSPHGPGSTRELRPIGASAWMRWPEFGFGIRPGKNTDEVAFFEAWRGARDERDWPQALRRGGKWPWSAITASEAHDVINGVKESARAAKPEPEEEIF